MATTAKGQPKVFDDNGTEIMKGDVVVLFREAYMVDEKQSGVLFRRCCFEHHAHLKQSVFPQSFLCRSQHDACIAVGFVMVAETRV